MFFGNTRFRITASRKTTATQLSAKTVRTISGKMLNIPVADVKPRPTLSERLTMTNEEKVLITQSVKEVGEIMSNYVGIETDASHRERCATLAHIHHVSLVLENLIILFTLFSCKFCTSLSFNITFK